MGNITPITPGAQAPREYGLDANVLQTIPFALDAARDKERLEFGGSMIWAYAASSLTAQIDIHINTQQSHPITFQKGMMMRGVPFSRLFITHAAQAGESITLIIAVEGESEIKERRRIQVENAAEGYTAVTLAKATDLQTIADVTLGAAATTQILAANALRRVVFISNLIGNTQTFRIGDNNAAAARGVPLAPGETIIVSGTDTIYGYNPGAAGEDVAVMWTAD